MLRDCAYYVDFLLLSKTHKIFCDRISMAKMKGGGSEINRGGALCPMPAL